MFIRPRTWCSSVPIQTQRQPSRAGNIHLAYADAPSGVVLTFFFDGAMVAKLYWLDDISFSAYCSSKYEQTKVGGVGFEAEGVVCFYVQEFVGIQMSNR